MLIALVGMGIGVGFFLHWIIPSVELGTGILTGVVATGLCLDWLARIMASDSLSTEDEEIQEILLKPIRSRRRSRLKKQP